MGGYCYYSNTALGAAYLVKRLGRVAILDIDYHHGNGQQEIFYRRNDVLTVSVHADPKASYPFFSGFVHETGAEQGQGYNLNLALPLEVDGSYWLEHGLRPALAKIRDFKPTALVVALGLDTAVGDPTGTWTVKLEHFREAGRLIGDAKVPTLIVQEGGYRTRTLGAHAVAFFSGFLKGRGLY
jgi:acetoin utilization deacetylase AcuC-like enzyme